ALKYRRDQCEIVLRLMVFLGLPFAIMAIVQITFFESLPESLLNFRIYEERVDYIMVGDNVLMRANGLFGNPLELTVFLSFLLTIVFLVLDRGNILKVVPVFLMAIVATLSRAGLAAAGMIIILAVILSKMTWKIKVIVFSILALIIFFLISMEFNQLLALIGRLGGGSEEAQQSTSSRFDYLQNTIDMLNLFPYWLTGYPLGMLTSGGDEVAKNVYDGMFLNVAVDYGIPMFIAYLLMHTMIMVKMLGLTKIRSQRNLALYGCFFVLVWLFFCTTNSAMTNTSCAVVFYLGLGCLLRMIQEKSPQHLQLS
ncbi:MAG: O-antigen ligase family protein, partial [Syntrophales bacterium]|nr:O-antigen ligase family protein [Syntrophales bacterium]